jgi:hypothetical protein
MSDELLERPAVGTGSSGRDWAGIGVGLAAAFALIAIFVAGVWALVVLAEASA